MKDRELIELAAKSAGIAGYRYSNGFGCMAHWNESDGGWFDACCLWNPLTDDGDALRLAVKLSLHICIDAESAGAITVEWGFDEGGCAQHSVVENSQDEPGDCAATRRAIVRAAAEIGRGM